jgi:hypothetical protein
MSRKPAVEVSAGSSNDARALAYSEISLVNLVVGRGQLRHNGGFVKTGSERTANTTGKQGNQCVTPHSTSHPNYHVRGLGTQVRRPLPIGSLGNFGTRA